MKKNILINVLLSVLLIIVTISALNFYRYSKKPHNRMVIGIKNGEMTSFGPAIDSVEEYNAIEFSIMRAESIEKPEITNKEVDYTLKIADKNNGNGYFDIDVWIDKNTIFLYYNDIDAEKNPVYKEIKDGDYLIKILNKYRYDAAKK